MSLDASYSLVIEPAQYMDSGRYTCIPSNPIGTAGESTGTDLNVRDPPHFTKKPADSYEAELQKSLQIPCKGSGTPPPHVSWRKVSCLASFEMHGFCWLNGKPSYPFVCIWFVWPFFLLRSWAPGLEIHFDSVSAWSYNRFCLLPMRGLSTFSHMRELLT